MPLRPNAPQTENNLHHSPVISQGLGLSRVTFADYDLFSPEQQSFPSSVAEVSALGWSSNVAGAWACQEPSGTTLADFSGNNVTLTIDGSATKIAIGKRAAGLFDGSSFVSQRAVEFFGASASGNDGIRAASGDSLDYDIRSDNFSVLVMFRIAGGVPASSRMLIGKRSPGDPNTRGWAVGVFSDGRAFGLVQGATTQQVVFATGNVCDGAWHWVYVRVQGGTATRIDTDLSTGSSVSIAHITDSSSNAAPVSLGAISSVNAPANGQIRGCIVWDDIDTAVASIQAWWRHGRAPSWMTYSRASYFSSIVADDATTGDVLAGWGSGQCAYGYSALCSTNPLRLGLSRYNAHTNLVPNTDLNDTTNWPATGTRTQYAEDSPRGFRESVKHTGTSGQSVLAAAANGASVTSGTTYTASIWCRWDGTGTAPTLEVYRADGTTLIASVNATDATGKRRRLQVSFSAPATEAIRLACKGRDGNAWFFGPMVNAGAYAMPWVPTKGGTATAVASNATAVPPAGFGTGEGTMIAWGTHAGQDELSIARYLAAVTRVAGTLQDAVLLGWTSTENPVVSVWDAAQVLDTQAATGIKADVASVETKIVGWWDRSERYGWSARVARNGETPGTGTPDIDAAALFTTLYLGSSQSTGNIMNGEISRVRIYTYPELNL